MRRRRRRRRKTVGAHLAEKGRTSSKAQKHRLKSPEAPFRTPIPVLHTPCTHAIHTRTHARTHAHTHIHAHTHANTRGT